MYEFVEVMMRPHFFVYLFGGIAVMATVFTIAMPLLEGDRIDERVKAMAVEREKLKAARLTDKDEIARLRRAPKGFIHETALALDLRSKFETDDLKDKMKMAGLRGEAPLYTFSFFRFVMPFIVFAVTAIYLFFIDTEFELTSGMRLLASAAAGFIGFYLPNVFLDNMIQRRQQSIKAAFPDALDMLLICVQSGMSVEASFQKVAKDVATRSIELAEELSLTTAELSYLTDRKKAYENLNKRTGLPMVKSVTTALIQAEMYGTPVGQALRVMAQETRQARMAEAEAKAASLPPKLTVPMIVFNLPVLIIIMLTPTVLPAIRSVSGN